MSAATELFADHGYGVTTNKDVADAAGISTGALYYYFASKLDMYVAIYREMQARIDARVREVMIRAVTFDGRLRGILEVAYELNLEDPSMARFQGTARVDRMRYPELLQAIPNPPGEGSGLMKDLIGGGIATGEILADRSRQVEAVVRTIFVGMVDSQSSDPARHRETVDGVKALLDGNLLRLASRQPVAGPAD